MRSVEYVKSKVQSANPRQKHTSSSNNYFVIFITIYPLRVNKICHLVISQSQSGLLHLPDLQLASHHGEKALVSPRYGWKFSLLAECYSSIEHGWAWIDFSPFSVSKLQIPSPESRSTWQQATSQPSQSTDCRRRKVVVEKTDGERERTRFENEWRSWPRRSEIEDRSRNRRSIGQTSKQAAKHLNLEFGQRGGFGRLDKHTDIEREKRARGVCRMSQDLILILSI